MSSVVKVIYAGSLDSGLPSGEYDAYHRADGWILFHHTGWWLVGHGDVEMKDYAEARV